MRRARALLVAVILLALCIAAALWVCGAPFGDRAPGAQRFDKVAPNGARVPCFATELAHLDARIAFLGERAAVTANDWTVQEALAAAYLERARFACRCDDFRNADAALARAFKMADPGSGPFLLRAQLHAALHRFDRIESDLVSIEKGLLVDAHTRAAIALLRGDAAVESGRADEAVSHYETAWNLDPAPASACALAVYHAKLGHDTQAAEWIEAAERHVSGPSPVLRSWLFLQRGLLHFDRGEYDAALHEYRSAGEILEDWWLVDEHIAEARALLGDSVQALEIYARVALQTGNPEFMAAIASLHKADGREEEALRWAHRAGAEFEKLLDEFPEAFAAHALNYCLEWDSDPERALHLAEANFNLRPGTEARILLACAYLKARRPESARNVIDVALAGPWRTAELHAAAADVYGALGNESRAVEEKRKARERNPHIFEQR